MRILHLNDQRTWRGGERQLSYLIAQSRIHSQEPYLSGRANAPIMNAGFDGRETQRFPLPFRGELDLYTAWRLAGISRKHRIDLIHAHTSHAHTHALLARAQNPTVKVVVSRRVDFVPKNTRINRWKYHSPDAVVCVSHCIEGIMHDFGVPDERLWTVHSGIDSARFQVSALPRSALPSTAEGPLLLNVAALAPHKDHQTLIRALPEVLKAHPRAQLLIAGAGSLQADLESLIEELGLSGAVHLLGHRDDIPQLLRAADLFVFSSKEEGLGTSVLDAMAARLPVVATDAGGIPETVRDGDTGYLVPRENPSALAERVIAALNNPEQARARAENAYRMIEDEFTSAAMAAGTAAIYKTVLDGAP